MNLIKLDTLDYPISMERFKKMFNVSWGEVINPVPYGYDFVVPTPMPSHTRLQKAVELHPVQNDGVWIQTWEIFDLTGSELLEAQALMAEEAEAAAYKQTKLDTIAANLPSWATVEAAIDNISDLASAKAFIKKLSRVVYLVVKHSVD